MASSAGESMATEHAGPFRANAFVLVALSNPREKFWGVLLEMSPAGLSVRGIDLNSFDDFARLVRGGEPVTPGAVFFPMQRVERMELDARNGEIPSLRERFVNKAGQDMARLIGVAAQPEIGVGCTLAEAQRRLVAATLAAVEDDLERAAELLGLAESELRSWMRR
jgi:hypothetical protein